MPVWIRPTDQLPAVPTILRNNGSRNSGLRYSGMYLKYLDLHSARGARELDQAPRGPLRGPSPGAQRGPYPFPLRNPSPGPHSCSLFGLQIQL